MPFLVPPVLAAGCLRQHEPPTLRASAEVMLRPWRADEAPIIKAAYADAAIQQWNLNTVDDDEAHAWIARWPDLWEAETDACWAVATIDDDTVLGRIALRDISLAGASGQVTYWVLPEARGRGVATTAAREVARWAIHDVGLHRLELNHSAANHRSCRVAEKAGFQLEGTRRHALLHPDGWHDMHLHAHLAP